MATFTPLGGGIDNVTTQAQSVPTPAANELWAQILGSEKTQYDDLPTGVTEDTTVSHSLHSNTVNAVHASNGVVYSGSRDDTVKAVDATDGSEIWSHSLHSNTVNAVHASNGVVYSGSDDNTVKAVDNTVVAADLDGIGDGSTSTSFNPTGYVLYASDGTDWYQV